MVVVQGLFNTFRMIQAIIKIWYPTGEKENCVIKYEMNVSDVCEVRADISEPEADTCELEVVQ